jgi:hypothetical protein
VVIALIAVVTIGLMQMLGESGGSDDDAEEGPG